MKRDPRQLDLEFEAPRLRLIKGQGQKKTEPLASRDAVARVLIEAGADLLLRRISAERAEVIEGQVDHILNLFDKVDRDKSLMPELAACLDELEDLMRDTRDKRVRRSRG